MQPLEGRFVVEQGDHDVAVLGKLLLPHDHDVPRLNPRVDHASTAGLQGKMAS